MPRPPSTGCWQVIYQGKRQVDPNQPAIAYEYPRISPLLQFNTSLGIKGGDRFDVRLLVNNVFNAHVPFPYTIDYNQYYDEIIGRNFRITATVHL